MAALSATITNNRLPRVVQRLVPGNTRRIREETEATANDVRANIVGYGLIDTGRMLGSVEATMPDRLAGEVAVTATSDDGFPYPVVQDRGSVHVPATGFFSKAIDASRSRFPRRLADVMRDVL